MDPKTEVTLELIETLRDAQLRHLRENFLDEKDGEYSALQHSKTSTDGYDYIRAALNLSAALVEIHFERDIERMKRMLDPSCEDEYIPDWFATDGICDEIWAVLPDDEDESPRAVH